MRLIMYIVEVWVTGTDVLYALFCSCQAYRTAVLYPCFAVLRFDFGGSPGRVQPPKTRNSNLFGGFPRRGKTGKQGYRTVLHCPVTLLNTQNPVTGQLSCTPVFSRHPCPVVLLCYPAGILFCTNDRLRVLIQPAICNLQPPLNSKVRNWNWKLEI